MSGQHCDGRWLCKVILKHQPEHWEGSDCLQPSSTSFQMAGFATNLDDYIKIDKGQYYQGEKSTVSNCSSTYLHRSGKNNRPCSPNSPARHTALKLRSCKQCKSERLTWKTQSFRDLRCKISFKYTY